MRAARAVRDDLDKQRRALSAALRHLPRARELATAWSSHATRTPETEKLDARLAKAAAAAETARAAAARAHTDVEKAATANDPPLDPTALQDWDPALAPAMAALGVALHEEAALASLLADLG